MLLFYIDESGHHRMAADPADPTRLARDTTDWFVLSAVGIRDTSRRPLAEAIDRVKRDHLGAGADRPWNETELKGRRLAITRRRVEGARTDPDADYAAITDGAELDALETEVVGLLAHAHPIVFTVAIDKRALFVERPGEPALGWAYAFLYRRIAMELERHHPEEGGILVADQQTEHEKAFRDHELTRIRDELAARGRLRADYRLLLDRPLWIDSSLSTWDREIIQLADLVAFTTHEGVDRGFSSAGARALWPTVRGLLAPDPATGDPDGEGLVIFPKPEAWPVTR
ncbi:DUF3800 domain-containing protein [Protaetiibacter intestinalis]|nr:DUF3800 domain-containing protein [Protaetiibacter intestinalis]